MVYPNCPYFCTDCTPSAGDYSFTVTCNVCLGNRVKDKYDHCVCPDEYVEGENEDPMCYLKNESGNGELKVYFSFDGGVNDIS